MNQARTIELERWVFQDQSSSAEPIVVHLPHSWNSSDGTTADYRRSVFTYRRTLDWDPTWASTRVFLEVDAANSRAEVRVNGRPVGSHDGGFSRFRFDLTEALGGAAASLEIFVDNRHCEEVYPLLADFTFFGGLYRGARLRIVPETHISLSDHGSSGVYLAPRSIARNLAVVDCRVLVENLAPTSTRVHCQVQVHDAQGVVAAADDTSVITRGSEFLFSLSIPYPRLWQGLEDPYRYRIVVLLEAEGKELDRREIPYGLRLVSVDPEAGFFLNGISTPLRGVCMHQDGAGKGWALSDLDIEARFALVREIGANVVRLAHYQHADLVYELCDRHGIVVWAEIPFITRMSETDHTGENLKSQATELIRQNYNHCSIAFWGLQNEITMLGPTDHGTKLVGELQDLVCREDRSRLTVQAQEAKEPETSPMNQITDLLAYNRYFGWYVGTVEDFDPWLTGFAQHSPQRPFGVSEYGCEGLVTYHSPTPQIRDYSEEYHALYHERAYGIFRRHPRLWGTFVWNLFDFASAFRDEGGVKGMNNKGLVTWDLQTKKDAFWFYKACWSAEPVVYIAGRRFQFRDRDSLTIKVYTNRPDLKVRLGDKLLTPTQVDSPVWIFEGISLSYGENRVTATIAEGRDEVVWTRVDRVPESYKCPTPVEGVAANWFLNIPGLLDAPGPLEFLPGRWSVRDRISSLMGDPGVRPVLESVVPHLTANPRFRMLDYLTLEAWGAFDPKGLPPAVLAHIHKELQRLPAKTLVDRTTQ